MKKHIVELIMGCLLLICFYYLSREAAAVSVEMNQKQVIVVDCGHGGMDPGMIGIDGLKEKDVNLAIGLKVKSALEKKDFQVVMTRETDVGLYDEDSNNKKVQDMQKMCIRDRLTHSSEITYAIVISSFNLFSSLMITGHRVNRNPFWDMSLF